MPFAPALTVGPGGDISWLAVAVVVGAVILLIALVALLSGRTARKRQIESGRAERALSPREILDRRFAAGEISREDYEEQAVLLGGKAEVTDG